MGICAALLDIPIISLIGLLRPHYNSIERFASVLGITGKPYSMIISGWWILYGTMIVLFACGLMWSMGKEHRFWWLGSLLIMIFGAFDGIGSGVFPCDQGCIGETLVGMTHHFVSTVGTSALLPAPLFMWLAWKHESLWKSYRPFTMVIQIAGALLFIALVLNKSEVVSAHFGKIGGLLQRMFYFVYYVWFIVLGLKLFRSAPDSSRSASPHPGAPVGAQDHRAERDTGVSRQDQTLP
jgi:hypothetical protein